MSDALPRRALLTRGAGLGALLALPGCGFRPLYAPEADGRFPAAAELAAIRVTRIPERRGQILAQELERRLAAAGIAEARYDLTVGLLIAAELQGYRRDGSPSRVRFTYRAPYTLNTMAVPPVPVATGTAQVFDAYQVPDGQFFAGVQSSLAADRRIIEQLARDIAERLALALRDRAAT